VRVSYQVTSYRKITYFKEEPLGGKFDVKFPPYVYETTGLWFELPHSMVALLLARFSMDLSTVADAVSSLATLCSAVVPLTAMCDRHDLGGDVIRPRDTEFAAPEAPLVMLYDALPGGNGICRSVAQRIQDVWRRALDVVRRCPCKEGCPSCVMSRGHAFHKKGAHALLELLCS